MSETKAPYINRGSTASMIVSSICNEHKDSDIPARSAVILRAFNDRFDFLEGQRDDLLAALRSLRNEIVGQLGIAREEIRAAISTTNLNCLERRIEAAEVAIKKAGGRQ